MKPFTLDSFPNDRALAERVAEDCLRLVWTVPSGRPFLLALSGGRIARSFLSALAARAASHQEHLDRVRFIWGDERCVPPTDPESNYRLADELLFRPANIPPDRIHRIRGELTPETAASEAERELIALAPTQADGFPEIDLVLLGMGEDGHVASLFPGESNEVMQTRAVYRSVVAAKPPPHRISLGYGVLAAARQVWVLASGTGKEAALAESVRPEGATPLARLLRLRKQTRLCVDRGTIP